MSCTSCHDDGVFEPDVETYRIAFVFRHCTEIVTRLAKIVLNGTTSVGLKRPNLDISGWVGVTPNDAVLDVCWGIGRNASVCLCRFVLYDGAIVKVRIVRNKTAATSFSCIVVDKAVPKRRPLTSCKNGNTASTFSGVVAKGAVDKLAERIGIAVDTTPVQLSMIVVKISADE